MTTITATIHQECYIYRSGNYGRQYTKGRIVKVTPTGQVSVQVANIEEPFRFKKEGKEIGGPQWHGRYIELDTEMVEKELAQREAQYNTNSKVAELIECISDHRTGHGDYHITTDVRAELTALIAAM